MGEIIAFTGRGGAGKSVCAANISYALSLSGKKVMLIDDIVTTGTSMGSAATLLRGLGAKGIIGVCIAIAYRDKNNFE